LQNSPSALRSTGHWWTSEDDRAVDTARVLAADAVQKVGNGHPGTAMSLAPAAYLLFQRFLAHDPADPTWIGRDRFVLSCGHSSLTLYIQLFLSGYGVELTDLQSFRTWGSLLPGHPEVHHTPGVETTTGPLGQGLATAVGMAMGARYERGLLDPSAAPGESIFDHTVWVIASDGDLEEGVTSEASSLAGTQQLGNLVVIWDDNRISIEDDTAIAFSEDVAARYSAYGWHVQHVDMNSDGSVNVDALAQAMQAAQEESSRPSFIQLRSIIGWPAPNLRNTFKAHGSALGAAEVAATKELLGFDADQSFVVESAVLERSRQVAQRGAALHSEWNVHYQAWRAAEPERAALLDRLTAGSLPELVLPEFAAGKDVSTRKVSGEVIQAIAAQLPEFVGGSADLAESNNTTIEGGRSFLPEGTVVSATSPFGGSQSPYGRILHFGVREHAMGSALNGMALSGLLRPFGGTFMVFSDYMRGAVRLSAIMNTPVTYVWTHDSIGLGEDGPTHQPVEHLWSLRAIPGLDVIRPADANEVAVAWQQILRNRRPAGLILTRQNVPTFERSREHGAPASGVANGGYVLADSRTGSVDVILIATGSEVQLAVAARDQLEEAGIGTRVVSMPCTEWFDAQPQSYRDSVLPPAVRARVSVEAGVAQGWWKYIGTNGRAVSLEHFGASADAGTLFREFGFTPEAIAAAARESLNATRT
jgi:transketolase